MISANKNIILVKNRMIVKLIDPCLAREVTSLLIKHRIEKKNTVRVFSQVDPV